ncbi:MAG: M20/M25/M40 family metallo-hydrolase [Ignavibacteriae bacterium]|nr:M20/M25/M40 family metallo-hydrolase [Ignavibacteriota bacterium]
MIKKILFTFLFSALIIKPDYAQNNDTTAIQNIYKEALRSDEATDNLRYLCKNIGHRLAGTIGSERAVEWVQTRLNEMNLDNVYLQDIMVRHWERGDKEYCYLKSDIFGKKELNICALGTSIGTGKEGLKGNVIEVKSFDELRMLGREKVEGKIVFFNNSTKQEFFNTFQAYGDAVGPRVTGAIEGAMLGAAGVMIRSVTLGISDFPHTGVMRYADSVKKIPAVALSTRDADYLSQCLKFDKELQVYFRTTCEEFPDKKSYNVIGEIKGSEFPDEIIVVSGHLDCWDLGEGAHDDGAGIVQAMDVLRIFKALDLKPMHTIRFIAFMDEEVAQRGGRKYAEIVKQKNEKHIAAIESDEGGAIPHGFSMESTDEQFKKISSYRGLLEQYGLFQYRQGGSAVDIYFLKDLGFPRIGLLCDSQRYFDFHHSGNDVFENVHPRELKLGSAALAALVYLIDKYGNQ